MVVRLRRERGCKAGHAGTLDPFATGLLLVLLDGATKLQRFLTGLPKTYLATARLGWRSSTGDPDGELTETGGMPESLSLPTGTVRQRVPMTSAVRVGGERLYRKAHRGEEVETPQRDVEVYRAELLGRRRGPPATRSSARRGPTSGPWSRRSGTPIARSSAGPRSGPFSVEDVGMEISVEQVAEMVPAVARPSGDERRRSSSPRCPTRNRGRAMSRSGPSTASTAATRR